MAGIHRDAPNPRRKRAATLLVLRELLAPIPEDLRGLRDRALRRSELAGIACADLPQTDRDFQLTLPRSKGSQTAERWFPCPTAAPNSARSGRSRAGCRSRRSPKRRWSGASGSRRRLIRMRPLTGPPSAPMR